MGTQSSFGDLVEQEGATEPSIEEIVIPATEVEPQPPSDCGCLHLRFTAEVIEVVDRRGEECKDTVLLQWPLEQINLLGVYSNIDKPEVSLHIYLLKAKAALQKCKSVYDASLRQ